MVLRKRRKKAYTRMARGSEVDIALLPSVSYISLTPRLSQIYTMTPLSNLRISKVEVMKAVDLEVGCICLEVLPKLSNLNSFWERTSAAAKEKVQVFMKRLL